MVLIVSIIIYIYIYIKGLQQLYRVSWCIDTKMFWCDLHITNSKKYINLLVLVKDNSWDIKVKVEKNTHFILLELITCLVSVRNMLEFRVLLQSLSPLSYCDLKWSPAGLFDLSACVGVCWYSPALISDGFTCAGQQDTESRMKCREATHKHTHTINHHIFLF